MQISIYISGPHGSGKTTLINNLLNNNSLFTENDFDINFFHDFPSMEVMNAFERCLVRLYHRIYTAIYTKDQCKIENESSNSIQKVLLVSRSIYDSVAYSQTEFLLSQMTNKEHDILKSIETNALNIVKPYTIILNPPVDVILSHLAKRKKYNERADRELLCSREDTYQYVKLVHDAFVQFKNNQNVLYITDNDDLSIKIILEWIENLFDKL